MDLGRRNLTPCLSGDDYRESRKSDEGAQVIYPLVIACRLTPKFGCKRVNKSVWRCHAQPRDRQDASFFAATLARRERLSYTEPYGSVYDDPA
jgi:hypothetical protein